jgi:hypothetical protein
MLIALWAADIFGGRRDQGEEGETTPEEESAESEEAVELDPIAD